MLIALNDNNERVEPTPSGRAICPICNEPVIAKCGKINVWHWAHSTLLNCDNWSETDSNWHYKWKKKFPINNCEIVIGRHIADIVTNDNEVIELQNNNISPDDIEKREKYFGNMIWIFNVIESVKNIHFRKDRTKGDNYYTFRWKHPKKHLAYTSKPTILDIGDELFILKKMYKSTPCGGWGYFISTDEFLRTKKFNNNSLFHKFTDTRDKWKVKESDSRYEILRNMFEE